MRFRGVLYPVFQALQGLGLGAIVLAVFLGGYRPSDLPAIAKMEIALTRAALPWASGDITCAPLSGGGELFLKKDKPTAIPNGTGFACGSFAIVTQGSVLVTARSSWPAMLEVHSNPGQAIRIYSSNENSSDLALFLPMGVMWLHMPPRSSLVLDAGGITLAAASEMENARIIYMRDPGAKAAKMPFIIASKLGSIDLFDRNTGSRGKIRTAEQLSSFLPSLDWVAQKM